jgi:Ca-activated chloride channel family protein
MARNTLLAMFVVLCSLAQQESQPGQTTRVRGKNGSVGSVVTETARRNESRAVEPARGDEVKLAVDLVVLDALVLHQKSGTAIGTLKREDFILREDGVQQEITHFGQDSLPLSVIFLVDRGGCLDPFSEKVRRATQEAMIRLKPEDEVALMSFADRTELITPFTTRRQRIVQGLSHLPPHDEQAEHCFSDAFYRAADYMRRAGNPDGRRVIVVITAITAGLDCGGHSGGQARQAILESGSVVCAIVPKTAAQRIENGIMRATAGLGGLFKAKSINLKQFTDETGGEVLSDKPDNLDRTFSDLISHLRTRYAIGFVSTNKKRDGGYRKLRLDVNPALQSPNDKLVVKTRRGYITSRR